MWRELTLDVARGDRVAVTGPSGSGKTLLLRCLAGLDRLDEGAITYDGRPALVTNRHVVLGAASVGLRELDGGPGPAVTDVLVSPRQDVAVLLLDEPLGSTLGIGAAPAAGDPVRVVGFPGARPITTAGAVEEAGAPRVAVPTSAVVSRDGKDVVFVVAGLALILAG